MRRSLVLLAMLIVIAGCQDQQRPPHVQSETGNAVARPVSVSATPAKHLTPSPTPTPTPTSTATHTLTPTPTPTPTAQPMTVDGSPRLAAVAQHSTLEGTGCQLVDLFDFPLNPPDGDGVARGGTDFGVYRSRYEQYHTGEDWWVSRGSGSFGAPVYSIGHGRVTYAAPLGWGRDQGVVIIRHTFDDGRQLLSFYGHLDPPSVSLSQGECVSRGQQIGSIGRPRTPPHLHFEIRTIMPDEPGGGYWWQDPTLAGWLPPSQTIWQVRLLASPGAEWLRAPQNRNSIAIGLHNERLYLLLEDQQLIGLDITSGEPRWSAALEERLEAAALDLADPTLYVADQLGRVTAFRLPDAGDYPEVGQVEGTLESLWKVDLDVVGIPQLIPLPGGGMMIVVWDEIIGLSPDGEVLWQRDSVDRPYEWLATGDQLLISTVGGEHSLWVLDSSGPRPWPGLGGGALAGQGEHVYLFNDAGLYGLNPADGSSRLISDWPSDSLRASDVMALEDGGALIAYVGRRDRRLVRFDMTGAIIWQRALPDELPGVPQFLETGDQPYLIATGVSDGTATVSLYAIDLNNAVLVHLFEGGTRTPQPNSDSVHLLGGNRLLLNIGGGHLVSLDLQQAAEAIVIASDSLPQ